MAVTENDVLDALKVVKDPDLGRDIVSLKFVKDVKICGGAVAFKVELTTPACPVKDRLKEEARAAVSRLAGVETVDVQMTSQVRSTFGQERKKFAQGVKNFVAVASGKGGVGKSTVAVNIACGLSEAGAKVGLLDCDIYGPSVPHLTGIRARPHVVDEKIQPVVKYGLKIMSMGFLVDEEQAIIWRGPMVHGALTQFLSEVDWGDLDYLILDMPPGTGDAQLTIVQTVPLTGAVIVSTPQEISLIDVRRAIRMFRQTKAPILGVVENMAYYQCKKCGEREEIFSNGGAKQAAQEWEVPFLGDIPIDTRIRVGSDLGKPIMADAEESAIKAAFRNVCQNLAAQISIRNIDNAPPKILPLVRK